MFRLRNLMDSLDDRKACPGLHGPIEAEKVECRPIDHMTDGVDTGKAGPVTHPAADRQIEYGVLDDGIDRIAKPADGLYGQSSSAGLFAWKAGPVQ
jgi:hypothetical protein